MLGKQLITFFLFVFVLAGVVLAEELLPNGVDYKSPVGGTLVFDEDYGSDLGKDGIGSWNQDTSTFTVESDWVTISTKGTAALLPLPFDVGETNCVIDIGINGWNASSSYSDLRFTLLMSSWGAKQSVKFSPVNAGTLVPVSGSGTAPNPQNTVNVVRLTSGYRGIFYAYSGMDDSEVSIDTYAWGATSDYLVVHNVSPNAEASVDIAWIKIYQDVEDRVAPLDKIPTDLLLPPAIDCNEPAGGVLVFEEDYGSGPNKYGTGSWDLGTADVTVGSDWISISVSDTYARLPIPVDLGENETVVDIGIKGWNSPDYGDLSSAVFYLKTEAWGAKFAAALKKVEGGIVEPEFGSGSVPFITDRINVLRFTSGVRGDTYLHTGTVDSDEAVATVAGWGSTENAIVLSESRGRSAVVDIAWIRVYKDVQDRTAPLSGPTPVCGDYYHPFPVGDLTEDCLVDFEDLLILFSNWLYDARF